MLGPRVGRGQLQAPPFASWSPLVGTGAPTSRPLPVPMRSECGLPGSPKHSLPLPYTLPSPWGACLRTERLLPRGHSTEARSAKGYGYPLTHLVGQSVNKHFRSTPYLQAPALLG